MSKHQGPYTGQDLLPGDRFTASQNGEAHITPEHREFGTPNTLCRRGHSVPAVFSGPGRNVRAYCVSCQGVYAEHNGGRSAHSATD